MTRMLSLLLGLGLAAPAAMAAGFEAKTMRETLSAREVERGLVIGKGWLEFGLGYDHKLATSQWTADGEVEEWDSARWTYTTQRLDIRYGIARRAELYWTVKSHYVHLENETLDTDITQWGLGDPNFGVKFEAFRSMAPLTSVIGYFDYKAPAANESPGNYVGGPTTFSSVVLTTGTPDITLGAQARRQVGPMALTLGLGYVYRASGLVQYAIETELNQFSSRIDPGDVVKLDGDLMLQVGPVALKGGAAVRQFAETRLGNSAKGLFQARDLKPIAGSDGWSLDAIAGGTVNVSRGFDVVAQARIPVRGEDLLFFPVEDLSPTNGITYSGTLEFRY